MRDPMDTSKLLVKRVVGVAGDRVRWDGSVIELNGRLLPHDPHPDAAALLTGGPDEIRSDLADATVLAETLDADRYPILLESDAQYPPDSVPAG